MSFLYAASSANQQNATQAKEKHIKNFWERYGASSLGRAWSPRLGVSPASHEVHAITDDSYDTNAFPIILHMLFLMASFAPVWYIACIYNLATSDLTKLESKIFKKKLSVLNMYTFLPCHYPLNNVA